MKIQFIKWDNLYSIKSNLNTYANKFKDNTNSWLQNELNSNIFVDTKYILPKIELDMSQPVDKSYLTDANNVQEFYGKLRGIGLSDSAASDERLWAGLCLGEFWLYTQYRWNIVEKPDVNQIKQHYFFGDTSPRRSLSRNALARLWWIGHLTYDETRADPFQITKFVCEKADNIMHIIERNTSNNRMITRAFVSAMLTARDEGFDINTNVVGELAKYLNLLGGTYILDCLPFEKIHDKIFIKAREIAKKM
jgi:hypothetical protein